MKTAINCIGFKDIYTSEKDGKKFFCYRTGMTVYEEVFDGYRYMSAGWNTAGYTLNVLDDMPTRLNNDLFAEAQSFDVEVDGVSLSWDWKFVDFSQNEEVLENGTQVIHGIVTLKSAIKPITVKVHTVLDGTPIFERYIEIENDGDFPANINVSAPICGGVETIANWKDYMSGVPDPTKIYSLGYMTGSEHNHEGGFKWYDLLNTVHAVEGKYQYADFRHPIFVLRNNLLGTIMIAEFGWTGGYRFEFALNTDVGNDQPPLSRLSFRTEIKGQKPIIILDKGEKFVTPKVHIGMMSGDLDVAINAMHKHLRKTVFTLPSARGVKGWVEGGMGPERLMDVTATKHFADTVAEVGGETLIIDAGWYCPLGTAVKEWWQRAGDWIPDSGRYPNGIKEIRDYIHSKGLLFGLWLDLERIGPSAKVYKEHPEWISKCYANNLQNTQLNMAIKEAAEWAESELSRVIEEYQIDLFRLDYNLNNLSKQNRYYGKNGLENAYVRYYQNTNAMYERLRRKYPNVVFENCAGGGGRTDVGFVSNFTHTWVSDHNVAPRSFSITNGMTMALPPEMVDRLVSGMGCHTRASLAWQVRNAIFGRPSTNDYNAVGSKMNAEQIEIVKHTLDIYKKHVRPYIDDSLIFHHTPELVGDENAKNAVVEQPRGTGIIERVSGDYRHGIVGVFNLADATNKTSHVIFPKGINPTFTYNVTFDNSNVTVKLSGFEIINSGIRVNLTTSLTSELIIFEAE